MRFTLLKNIATKNIHIFQEIIATHDTDNYINPLKSFNKLSICDYNQIKDFIVSRNTLTVNA